jgi:hypothetical protein
MTGARIKIFSARGQDCRQKQGQQGQQWQNVPYTGVLACPAKAVHRV